MLALHDRVSLIKAARTYFLDGRSQGDIARVLSASTSNVSRLLTVARDCADNSLCGGVVIAALSAAVACDGGVRPVSV